MQPNCNGPTPAHVAISWLALRHPLVFPTLSTPPLSSIRVDAAPTTNYTQTMECKKSSNARFCNCTYPGCERHGICSECLHYHLGMRQLPACCFPEDVERTYDRSFERFAGLVNTGKV